MEEEKDICKLHESLKCEVDKGKFLRKVIGSKIILSILGTAFLFIISWGIWVTNFIYVKASEQSSERIITQKTSEDIDEVKEEVKEIKKEIKDQTETINKNQQDILKLLLEMQKEQRKNDGQKTTPRTTPK